MDVNSRIALDQDDAQNGKYFYIIIEGHVHHPLKLK